MSNEEKPSAVRVLVCFGANVIGSITFTATDHDKLDVEVSYCCTRHLIGISEVVREAVIVLNEELLASGLMDADAPSDWNLPDDDFPF